MEFAILYLIYGPLRWAVSPALLHSQNPVRVLGFFTCNLALSYANSLKLDPGCDILLARCTTRDNSIRTSYILCIPWIFHLCWRELFSEPGHSLDRLLSWAGAVRRPRARPLITAVIGICYNTSFHMIGRLFLELHVKSQIQVRESHKIRL